MNDLRSLVTSYVDGKLDLASFRDAFVRRFLTAQCADERAWRVILAIESACADYSEGLVNSERELKYELSKSLQPIRIAPAMSAGVVQANFGYQVSETSTNQAASSIDISMVPASVAEIELEFAS